MSDTAAATDATPDTGTAADSTDWKSEADKWQALARKHEERAKSNISAAKELEQLKAASMSDLEKAVAQARAEARIEALREAATGRVDDAVRAAIADRSVDVEALLEGLDRSRFVTDDGEPDRKAIAAWVDRIAPKPEPSKPGFPDLGQGVRPNSSLALNGDPLLRDLKSKLGIS
jgi:hypothetical protein